MVTVAWTTPVDLATAHFVTASDWDTAVSGNTAYLGAIAVDAPPGRRRLNYNGEFFSWQRGAGSFTTNNAYTADGYQLQFSGGSQTVTQQALTMGGIAGSEGFFLQTVAASQSATTDFERIAHKIEDVRRVAGKSVTVSFYANAGSGTPKVGVEIGQSFGTGGSPSADVTGVGSTVTLSTTTTLYHVSNISVPSVSGKTLGTTANTSYTFVNLWTSAGSTLNTRSGTVGIQNATIQFWGLQVEQSVVPTIFEQWLPQETVTACKRYFQNVGDYDGSNSSPVFTNYGSCAGTTAVLIGYNFPVTMRVIPTVSNLGTITAADNVNATISGTLALSANANSVGCALLVLTITGGTQYRPYQLQGSSTTARIYLSAEF